MRFWQRGAIGIWAILAASCGRSSAPEPVFQAIPGGWHHLGSRETLRENPPRRVRLAPFEISSTEITVAQFALYLRDTGRAPPAGCGDFISEGSDGSTWNIRRGCGSKPATGMRRDEAEAYARWLSARLHADIRLPTEEEWEAAARGGLPHARYPWGWGSPEGKACFAAASAEPVGRYAANPYGLSDMAGNVFEWCAGTGPETDKIPARGGAWAEKDERMLQVFSRNGFRRDYAGGDVGFRVVRGSPELLPHSPPPPSRGPP